MMQNVCFAVNDDKEDYLDLQLNQGAKVEWILDDFGRTALHLAAESGSIKCIQTLIKHKANVDCQTNGKFTPLIYASQKGYPEIIAELGQHGADVELMDRNGHTALFYAAEKGHNECVNNLVKLGAVLHPDAIRAAAENGHASTLAVLAEHGANVNCQFGDGNCQVVEDDPPFHRAARNGHIRAVEELVKLKVDVNCQNTHQQNALHRVVKGGNLEMVQLLVRCGVSVNCQDDKLQTPVHLAASCGEHAIFLVLMRSNADIHLTDEYKRTALHRACTEGHTSIVKELIKMGAKISLIDARDKTALCYAKESHSEAHSEIEDLLMKKMKPTHDQHGNSQSSADRQQTSEVSRKGNVTLTSVNSFS